MTKIIPTSQAAAQKLRDINRYGIAAQGRSELIAHHKGKHLTRDEAIRAYCYGCMGYYTDGKADCQQADCPLHPFMPYKTLNNVPTAPVQPLPEKNVGFPDSSPKAERLLSKREGTCLKASNSIQKSLICLVNPIDE